MVLDFSSEQPHSELVLYKTEDGNTHIEVHLQDETVWLNQKMMAELFQKDVRTINEHIQNIYTEHELEPHATIRKFRIVQTEGTRNVERQVDFYNLERLNKLNLIEKIGNENRVKLCINLPMRITTIQLFFTLIGMEINTLQQVVP